MKDANDSADVAKSERNSAAPSTQTTALTLSGQAASAIGDWGERRLKTAAGSSKTGFGRQLVEKALKFSLRARTKLTFNLDGVSCHIENPLPAAHEQDGTGRMTQYD